MAIRLTARDRINLTRFGCTLLPRDGVVCIAWDRQRAALATSATIVALFTFNELTTGPISTLAFEISTAKARPHYCFLPINLHNASHRKFAEGIVLKRRISLCFIAGQKQIRREHEISETRSRRMAELIALAIPATQKASTDKYNFESITDEFEHNVRLADFFDYALPENELSSALATLAKQAEVASPERREQANRIARDWVDATRPAYEVWVKEQINQLPSLAIGFRFLSDLRDHIPDAASAIDLLSNGIAANAKTDEDFSKLETLTVYVRLGAQALEWLKQHSGKGQTRVDPEKEAEVREIITRLMRGQGLSIPGIQTIFEMFGLRLKGLPGRNPKDYSAEYDLRAQGKGWREVARYRYESDAATKAEYGDRTFEQLNRVEIDTLMHRVREGLRGFAKRTNRPFPPIKIATPPPPEQTNPS